MLLAAPCEHESAVSKSPCSAWCGVVCFAVLLTAPHSHGWFLLPCYELAHTLTQWQSMIISHVQAVNVLLNFLQDRIDSVYDRFELFCLANVLRVPPHIKLPTDLPLADLSVSAEREAELKVRYRPSVTHASPRRLLSR